jgi:hypothetical protein
MVAKLHEAVIASPVKRIGRGDSPAIEEAKTASSSFRRFAVVLPLRRFL